MALAENRGLTRRLEQRVSERTADENGPGEKRFEALVKHSSDAVSLVDLEGRIRYQSESALAVLGYPAESLIGRQFSELLDEASRDRSAGDLPSSAPPPVPDGRGGDRDPPRQRAPPPGGDDRDQPVRRPQRRGPGPQHPRREPTASALEAELR